MVVAGLLQQFLEWSSMIVAVVVAEWSNKNQDQVIYARARTRSIPSTTTAARSPRANPSRNQLSTLQRRLHVSSTPDVVASQTFVDGWPKFSHGAR